VLIAAELLLAIGAIGGAVGLITGWLDLHESADDLPWQSPVLAGFALLLCNGVVPLAVVRGATRDAVWAAKGHVAVGVVLLVWIAVQVAFIGFNSPLQIVYAVYGAAVVALGLWDLRARPHARHRPV
jgi:hypothetical protein